MPDLPISANLTMVNERITAACQKASRSRSDVLLLAVSKTKPLAALTEAYDVGQRHFAENYAQEAIEKYDAAPFKDAIWHFIGPLQSNKTRGIAERYDWVHTIEREKIAKRLNDQRPVDKAPLNVLIQVNISDDPAKAGVTPSQINRLADQIAELPNLRLRGLMAIPAADLNERVLTEQYTELKKHLFTLIQTHPDCTELSIGMSGDFEIAIACGATMVRIGSDIFGARDSL